MRPWVCRSRLEKGRALKGSGQEFRGSGTMGQAVEGFFFFFFSVGVCVCIYIYMYVSK